MKNTSLVGKSVAVVGSGISGLSAAWLLQRSGAKVTLYEKDDQCGGHTLTDRTTEFPVDLGFQVYNLTTYPHLVGFLEALEVDTLPSDMSFALSMDQGKLEWGSDSLDTVFAQRSNLFSLSFLSMVKDVVRFGKEAPKVLEPENERLYRSMTLGQYLSTMKYSPTFVKHYVVPMCAAVWSVPNQNVLEFPVQMLIRFWVNHHLLDIFQRPLWRVVKGRSQAYVAKVVSELKDVRTSTGVTSVVRLSGQSEDAPAVRVTDDAGGQDLFHQVVLATHSDITMKILGDGMDEEERSMLASIPYNDNQVFLHTDETLMPKSKKVWSSWNLIGRSSDSDTSAVCVSYYVNRLQELPSHAPDLFVTLNPLHPPQESKVIRKLTLSHPVFSFASVQAQAKLKELQGRGGIYYAGAWCGYGFHEDGIKSAVEVVRVMGGIIPWQPRSTNPKSTLMQRIFMGLFDRFAKASIKRGYLRLILPSGHELRYGSEEDVDPVIEEGEEWKGRPKLKATLRLYSFDFFRKVVSRHDTGLGESFMDGDYETNEVSGLMALSVANAASVEDNRGKMGLLNYIGDKLLLLAHKGRPNTLTGSRKNIEEHYDAGNDMYKLFLDPSMMYSAAIHHKGESLYDAQMNKLDAIINQAGIKSCDHVLEIGCGWGAFAIRAAQKTGCKVTCLTISKEQLSEANDRVKALGLDGRITILFCDYRDCPGAGTYDKVVSIEMIEAVGHEHLVPYFNVIGRMLKPEGRAVIQAICTPNERYEAYCNCGDFIREHIFPGGHLPCIDAMVDACKGTGLHLTRSIDIGTHYAITLREWKKQWEEKKEEVLKLGYSERFWRKYLFYFSYCEAGFDFKYIHDYHLTFDKQASNETTDRSALPLSPSPASIRGPATGGGWEGLRQAVGEEVPSDPLTQVLLSLYFFLAGLLVRGHPFMWLLPLVTTICVMAHSGIHAASIRFLPFYRSLSIENQCLWCADLAHIAYSTMACLASIAIALSSPLSLIPWSNKATPSFSPEVLHTLPCAIACASGGFFAFNLWVSIRFRLFTRSSLPIFQYTFLLLLFVIAAYKGISLALLSATLIGEGSSIPYLWSKLIHLSQTNQLPSSSSSPFLLTLARVERIALGLTGIVHASIALIVIASPTSFGSSFFFLFALTGLGYINAQSYFRAVKLSQENNAGANAGASRFNGGADARAHVHTD